MKEEIAIFWFRRDLRLNDNAGLFHALKSGLKVLPIFIFDTNILDKLESKQDRRVDFIFQALLDIKISLRNIGSDILLKTGNPEKIWMELFAAYNIKEVYTNHDYEKYGIVRDEKIKSKCNSYKTAFYSFKDQCIFEKKEILSASNTPYTVFTPYSRKWKEKLKPFYYKSYPTEKYFDNFIQIPPFKDMSLQDIGFEETDIKFARPIINEEIVKKYSENRDFPSKSGTTNLSIHLRFGSISIRHCVEKALELNQTWLNELIWRDFYMNILSNFSYINDAMAFKKQYDKIPWRNNEQDFEAWCKGNTGYLLVDAGMRELNATGFMHNRVRMVVASFLCKHLLIDWRWGEAYFAQKLNDFDFSANNGGWQWASGSGCDAAPYFRVFNPSAQAERFDKNSEYIKKWIPNTSIHPMPIVDHKFARERALKVYKEALNNQE